MKFKQLQRRVARAEDLVEGRKAQMIGHLDTLVGTWRSSWTPLRIVIAGLTAGFLTGRSDPVRSITATNPARWLQLANMASGLFTTLQQTIIAAKHGADNTAASASGPSSDTQEAASSFQADDLRPPSPPPHASNAGSGETLDQLVRTAPDH